MENLKMRLSKVSRTLATAALGIALSGCSSAWVVSHDLEGGVIGYTGFDASDEALAEIGKRVQCPYGFEGVSDELRSAPYQYTAYETVSSYGTHTRYGRRGRSRTNDVYQVSVPVTRTGTKQWREYRYRCLNTPPGQSGQSGTSRVRPVAE